MRMPVVNIDLAEYTLSLPVNDCERFGAVFNCDT